MATENKKSFPQLTIIDQSQLIQEEDGISPLDLLIIPLKYKIMILTTCAVTFLLSCIIALRMPDIYVSTARILPPQQNRSGFSSMIGEGKSDLAVLAGIPTRITTGELYVGMLKSRTISNAIIDHFNLMEVYGLKLKGNAYSALQSQVNIVLGRKDGILSVSVENKDPQLAAAIANKYIKELKKLNIHLNLGTVGRERKFLENRLSIIESDLARAEEELKSFQEKNTAIRIDDQATAIIEAIAALKAELAKKEIKLGVQLSFQTEQNPQIRTLRESITQLKSQIHKLERSPSNKKLSGDIFIATSEVPELGVQYARLVRDFKIQETLFELLTKQYEIAKINEARNTSTIQILDEAAIPDIKSKPRRSRIVLLATFAMTFVAILAAFLREFCHNFVKENPSQWQEIRDFFSFKKTKKAE